MGCAEAHPCRHTVGSGHDPQGPGSVPEPGGMWDPRYGHSRGSSADCHYQSLSPGRVVCVVRAIPPATPRGPARAAQAALPMVIFSPTRSPDHTSERIADDELRDPRSCELYVHDASWLVRGHGS